MRTRTASAFWVAAAAGATGAIVLFGPARAGGEKVAFPEGFEKGVLYATIDRYDVKQFRELYANKEAVDAVRKGQPIPSGTVLTLVQYKAKVDEKGVPVKGPDGRFVKDELLAYTVMEKRAGWGAEYPPEMRNGEWEYQAFTAKKEVNPKANLKACFMCHKPHEKLDFVISLASLSGTFPTAKATAKTGPGTVAIAEFLFGPEKLSVKAGQPITWTNVDDSPHQVSVQGQQALRTEVMLKGQSATLTFKEPGTYDYICGLHPNMKGKVEVTQ